MTQFTPSPYALPEHHTVTVRTKTEDEGTPDAYTYLDEVTCECAAPADAPCRTYPDCYCEVFNDDPDNPGHDYAGHPFLKGRPCWVEDWFKANHNGGCTEYVGADATDAADCGVPIVDAAGHILVGFDTDHLTWEWANPQGDCTDPA